MLYYVLKVKSKDKIPDFLQVRDEGFILKGYYRLDRPLKKAEFFGLETQEKENEFWEYIHALPFNKIFKIDITQGITVSA